jgi:hypothetical protein
MQGGAPQGMPQAEHRAPTVPLPFALKTGQRAAEHSGAAPGGVFGAQGGGGRVTRSRAGKKAAAGGTWTGQPTHPQPFHLATDTRGWGWGGALGPLPARPPYGVFLSGAVATLPAEQRQLLGLPPVPLTLARPAVSALLGAMGAVLGRQSPSQRNARRRAARLDVTPG